MKIVSGGQTGADQAALEWALENGIPIGGWCPKGRITEDVTIPECFPLKETPKADYPQRTEWNVRDSDATVIFTIRAKLSGGSLKTWDFAKKHGKPVLHLSRDRDKDAADQLRRFWNGKEGTLNVAGSRGSKEPEVGDFVKQTLVASRIQGPANVKKSS
jgi:hypothetical protein